MIDHSGISGADRQSHPLALTRARGRASVVQLPPEIIEAEYIGRVYGQSPGLGSAPFQAQVLAQHSNHTAHDHNPSQARASTAPDRSRHAIISYAFIADLPADTFTLDIEV